MNAVTLLTEKMRDQLEKVPTGEKREAMVMELNQTTVETASSTLPPRGPASLGTGLPG